MSYYQPTLREAEQQAATVERQLAFAVETVAVEGGFMLRFKRMRYMIDALWPISSIINRCDDCGCVLRSSRDAGGVGFYYDRRWLAGDPAKRNPQFLSAYENCSVCLSCFNRARPHIKRAQAINENRLIIQRLKQELRHAA